MKLNDGLQELFGKGRGYALKGPAGEMVFVSKGEDAGHHRYIVFVEGEAGAFKATAEHLASTAWKVVKATYGTEKSDK